jgi:hypothetical protein
MVMLGSLAMTLLLIPWLVVHRRQGPSRLPV